MGATKHNFQITNNWEVTIGACYRSNSYNALCVRQPVFVHRYYTIEFGGLTVTPIILYAILY